MYTVKTIKVKDAGVINLLKSISYNKRLLADHVKRGGKLDDFKIKIFSQEELDSVRCKCYKYAF